MVNQYGCCVLGHRPVFSSKHYVSETGFCLRPQANLLCWAQSIELIPIGINSVLRKKQDGFLDKDKTMDNVQEHSNHTSNTIYAVNFKWSSKMLWQHDIVFWTMKPFYTKVARSAITAFVSGIRKVIKHEQDSTTVSAFCAVSLQESHCPQYGVFTSFLITLFFYMPHQWKHLTWTWIWKSSFASYSTCFLSEISYMTLLVTLCIQNTNFMTHA
jgi:hypothetical protein